MYGFSSNNYRVGSIVTGITKQNVKSIEQFNMSKIPIRFIRTDVQMDGPTLIIEKLGF